MIETNLDYQKFLLNVEQGKPRGKNNRTRH